MQILLERRTTRDYAEQRNNDVALKYEFPEN